MMLAEIRYRERLQVPVSEFPLCGDSSKHPEEAGDWDENGNDEPGPEPWDPDDTYEGMPRLPTDLSEETPEEPEEPTDQD